MAQLVLAGGCFWCLDAVYRQLRGVTGVVSGYTGGSVADPSYALVCSGSTGHAEAVRIEYDPERIGEDVLLDVFFTMHDPTQLDRQGNDIGTQYRSAMFYADEQQRAAFEAARERAHEWWDGEIVTEITPLGPFYEAEDYHQDYYAHNPEQGYCQLVTRPKVLKIRRHFAEYLAA